jgi:hypothetical protein
VECTTDLPYLRKFRRSQRYAKLYLSAKLSHLSRGPAKQATVVIHQRVEPMRFFIDYKARDQSLYDYQGDEFLSSKDALDFAQETAL